MLAETWFFDDHGTSPRVPSDPLPTGAGNPFTERDTVYLVLSAFAREIASAVEAYGRRKGRWDRSAGIGQPATLVDAPDSPAALRRTLEAAEITYLASHLLDQPGLTSRELREAVAGLDLRHTGDLPSRLRGYVERVAMSDDPRDNHAT